MGKCWLLLPMNVKSRGDRPRAAPRAGRNALLEGETTPNVFELSIENKPKMGYYNKKEAETAAEEYAKANPGSLVYLCESVEVFETLTPKVVKKSFNADGELLPQKEIRIDAENNPL